MRLTVCEQCGNPIASTHVMSWSDVAKGRKMFWECPTCGAQGSLLLSDQVLQRLRPGRDRFEDEVNYFRTVLDRVADLGDIWEWEFLEAPKEDERGMVG